jgi:hypothetical protein
MDKKPKRITLQEALAERDAASATCIELIAEMRKMIETLKSTRYSSAEAEAREAEEMIKRIVKGKKAR